ncbi:AMP-binding protein [Nocardia crassostreae]|uniref:AMP-binding protein n=1 Tax=Nocardia crassostreae TaxID=53428 RepID=UPI000B1F9023|nr:AMP-binding protein [Nocardia crassostreae]
MSTTAVLLIGSGSVLARCGEVLLAKGHRIRAVITDDATAHAWAVKVGIPDHEIGEAVRLAPEWECDLLLSIGNYSIVPDVLLACAKRMSVNYHYGPLPEYSGLYAPSWAIADGVRDYAITWHRIGGKVDSGDILRRVPVPMDTDETALSLGLKCDEAAVASLAELIDEIVEGRETATPQDLSARRYFSRHTQFPAEGLIDWERPAEEIAAMVRAADYGPFSGPLVWPKVMIDGRFVAVREAHAGPAADAVAPGAVLTCDEASGVRIGTAAGVAHLTRISTLDGEPIDIDTLATSYGLAPGMTLAAPDESAAAAITAAGKAASKAGEYWRARLTAGDPHRLHYPAPEAGSRVATGPVTVRCRVEIADEEQISATAYLAGAWCAFLSRATGNPDIRIGTAAPRDGLEAAYRDLFTAWLPLPAHLDAAMSVAENLRTVGAEYIAGQERPWVRRDLFGRDEALRRHGGEALPDVVISSGGAAFATAEARPVLELAVLEDGETVEFHYDTARLARSDVERLAGQFGDWCDRLPSLADTPLGAAQVVSAHERRTLIEEFNATVDDAVLGHSLPRLYAEAATAHAGNAALICAGVEVTYADLDADANRIAHALVDKGIGRGDLVGVALDRSIDLVAVLLAVLKTGAAYVPIDPNFPARRIRQMIEDADPKLIITPALAPDGLSDRDALCLSVDAARDSSDETGGLDRDVYA